MNHIYKVVWSRARNCYMAVSEIAKGHGKSSGKAKGGKMILASLAVAALACGTTAYAAYDPSTNTDTLTNRLISTTRDTMDGDMHTYNHADRNLVINWYKDNGRGDGSAIRNANVNAKNITINADFEGNQWDDKGIISDSNFETNVTASGDITIRTHDDAVHTENYNGKMTIDGFKNLNITTTGAGFGVMDAGNGVFINGGAGSTVNISALTRERPAIGASLKTELAYYVPKYAMGTGITINADKIILSSPYASVYAGIGKNHDFKVNLNAKTVDLTDGILAEGGSTVSINPDIDGVVKITSSKENNSSIMASMDYSTGKVSNVIINGNKGGTVQALGEIEADDASVYINMTGAGSYINSTATGNTTEDSPAKDVLLANGDKAKIKLDFSGNNSLIRGDMNATDSGTLDINASSDNFSIARTYTWDEPFRHGVVQADRKGTANLVLTGDHNQIDGSLKAYYNGQINLKMSGNDAVFNGNMWTEINTPKESPQHSRDDNAAIRAEFSGKNAQMKGDIVSREGHSQITADFSGENGKLTGDAKAIGTFEMTYDSRYPDKRFYTLTDDTVTNLNLTGAHTSQTGNLEAEGNNTLNASYTGLGSSLTGNADNKGLMNLTFDNQSSMTGNMTNDTMKYDDDKGTTFAGKLKANFNNGSRWTGDLTNTSDMTTVGLDNGSLWAGDLSSTAGSTTVSLNNGSAWTGASTGNGDITLTNGSLWTLTKDSTAGSVNPDGSSVISLAGNAKKLEVQKLGGSGGTFLMDLKYQDNDVNTYRDSGDYIIAHGGSGSAYNVSLTNGSSVNGMTDGSKLYFASTAADSSTFRMNQAVQVENYKKIYNKNLIVKKETDATSTDLKGYDDWFLTPDTSKGNGGNTVNPNGIVPGSAANTAFALWRDDDTLLKRLGELRNDSQDDGIWARLVNKHLERDGRHGFEGNYKTIQVGYDKKRDTENNGSWYYGGAISHLWGDTDYTDGHGSQKETDLSLYGTNIRPHGHYLDLIARVGRIDSDYTTSYGDHGKFENWGMSLGAEYGRQKSLGGGWSIEPQAQLTYHYLWGDDYTTRNGAKVNQDNADSLVGRLGFVLSREFNTGTDHAGRVYLKASILHDFLGDTTSTIVDDIHYRDDDDLGDTWYIAGIGTDINLGKNTRFYFDAERNFNADVKMKYRFNAGLRFGF